jgi:hypothetical protein
MRTRWIPLIVSAGLVGTLACDSPKPAPAAVADEKKADEDAEFEKRMEERRQQRLAEQKEKEEAEAKKKSALDAVAVLPDKMPKGLGAACEQVGDAYDAYMKRTYAEDQATLDKWNSAKGTQLPMTIASCTKAASVEVAACQSHGLENAPAELEGEQAAILRTCIEKFGQGGKGTAIPSKPG